MILAFNYVAGFHSNQRHRLDTRLKRRENQHFSFRIHNPTVPTK